MDTTAPKKAGRPPKGDTTMTPTQRAAAYRARRARAASEAGDNLAAATDRELVDRLNSLLAAFLKPGALTFPGLVTDTYAELARRFKLVS